MDVLGAAVSAAAEALAAEPAPPASEYDDAMLVDGDMPHEVKMEDEPEAEPLPPPLRDKPTAEELAALVKQRQLFHAQSETMLQLAKRHKEVTGACLQQRVRRRRVSARCLRSRSRALGVDPLSTALKDVNGRLPVVRRASTQQPRARRASARKALKTLPPLAARRRTPSERAWRSRRTPKRCSWRSSPCGARPVCAAAVACARLG